MPHYLNTRFHPPIGKFFQFLQQHLPPICSDMASLICHFNSCRALSLSPFKPIRIFILLQAKVKLEKSHALHKLWHCFMINHTERGEKKDFPHRAIFNLSNIKKIITRQLTPRGQKGKGGRDTQWHPHMRGMETPKRASTIWTLISIQTV